ncbi:putative reverse transcriptase domain-containing protein [Tanacetum coccineum]
MPPRMRTRSAGRPTAESLEGGTGVQVGRGGRGRIPSEGNDERVDELNGQGNDQGCSYKDFLACNPKEYDGKGGDVVLTRWIKKLESVHDMSGCSIDQNVKYTAGSFVGKALTWCNSQIRTLSREVAIKSELWNHAMVGAGHSAYTDRFHELARLVPHLVTPESRMIERFKKIGNVGEPRKDKNGRDDNKRARTGNAFATIVNPVGRENTGTWPKCKTYNSYHAPGGPCRICFNCNSSGQLARDCRSVSRNVILSMLETQLLGHVMSAVVPTMSGQLALSGIELKDREKIAQIKFLLITGVRVVKTKGTRLGVGFISTTFIPLLGLEPNDLFFKYEIKIASGQLVETDKVIKGCKLEIEGHVFDIDLIPFGHGSFDVIIGMDWLSNYKAEIICHEKVVRIPLPDGKVLRVVGE